MNRYIDVLKIVLLLCCAVCDIGAAEAYNNFLFKTYKVEDGLSQNTVFSIFQDSNGFMWFGTNDGLNRFDGYEFRIFRRSNEKCSLGNNKITDIAEVTGGRLFIGTAKGIYVFSPESECFSFFDRKTNNGEKITVRVNSFFNDTKSSKLWISTNGKGVFVYDYRKDALKRISAGNSNLRSDYVENVFVDGKGNIWVASKGLAQYNEISGRFKYHDIKFDAPSDFVKKIYVDNYGTMWLASQMSGLIRYDYATGVQQSFLGSDSGYFAQHIHDICRISNDVLFVGSDSELVCFNIFSGEFYRIRASKDMGCLSDNSVYSFCVDKEGGIWIGTFFGGVNYIRPAHKKIELFTPGSGQGVLHGKAISRFCEDKYSRLWIATEDAGLNCYDPVAGSFRQMLAGYDVQPILADGDDIWVGTYGRGLLLVDMASGSIRRKYKVPYNNVSSNFVLLVKAVYKDRRGTLWVGSNAGLCRLADNGGELEQVDALQNNFIWDIIEDKNNDLWVVTSGNGVFRLSENGNILKHFRYSATDTTSLSDDNVLTLCKDINDNLWFGTEENGFCRYDYKTGAFVRYDNVPGFSNWLIYSIVSDDSGNLWIATSNGLYRYDVASNAISRFTIDDGLQSNQFNFNSGYKSHSGKIYFGGVNGFNAFFPGELGINTYVPPVRLVDFYLNNKIANVGAEGSPLEKSITYSKKIELSYDQNVFSIDFVALSYSSVSKNKYVYKLDGFDKDWIPAGQEHRATYNGVPPGHYTFMVKASNNDGVWNKNGVSLEIVINPPFWKTWWAYCMYVLLVGGLVYFAFRWYLMRERDRQRYEIDKIQVEREKELYDNKINFFTNIAHEIRTPLSLIIAPVERIMNDASLKKEHRESLEIVDRNGKQLRGLITELLDFRKIESGSGKLVYSRTNISEAVENNSVNFKAVAESRGISLNYDIPEKPVFAYVDRDALRKILRNLMSNAVKFASSRINVSLSVDSEANTFSITVADDGIGVPESEKEKIFEPFRQSEQQASRQSNAEGIGLGLSYARSLAEMHKGSLVLQDNEMGWDRGAVFVLTLPVGDSDVVETAHEPSSIEKDLEQKTGNPVLLIVEDNEDMLTFLCRSLSDEYETVLARNGAEALEVLQSRYVDMVITDIMMPKMDGIELVKHMKEDMNLCHIPITVLTAKTSAETRKDAYISGADAYIEKPFSVDLLRIRVKNLFDSRKSLHRKYACSPYMAAAQITRNKMDEDFVNKLKSVIVEHLQEEEFGVDELASFMNMSRSALFAKVKGVSGMTPLDFIRVEKLKKAAEFIVENKYSISEIAMMVGYSTPSYFAKCFSKQFGVLPKDFRKGQI